MSWTLGGGTALMLQIAHRDSHDIDLFIPDPQFLPFLNPVLQEHQMWMQPSGYQTDGTGMLKIAFKGVGEIDFICSGMLTKPGSVRAAIAGNELSLETPEEIIAKKIRYRGSNLQPRDMFDTAATVQHHGEESLIAALLPMADACATALRIAERMDQTLVRNIIGQLAIRQPFEYLREEAQDMTVDFLRKVVDASTAGSSPAQD